MQDKSDLEKLEEKLEYRFSNNKLRTLALTHPSFYNRGEMNVQYERLEFLGDAVLELVVTEYLFLNLSSADEGLMTQLRARVVGRPNLAKIARELGLNKVVRLGKGEEQTGGRDRESTMANTFEALMGAVFLDSGFETSKKILLKVLEESLKLVSSDLKEDNPKGELQTLLQKLYPESPCYMTMENNPPVPAKFTSEVTWRGIRLGVGDGESKRKAEVAAALDSLDKKMWLGSVDTQKDK